MKRAMRAGIAARTRVSAFGVLTIVVMSLVACSGGDDAPKATATPTLPGPEDAIAAWVDTNRSVGYVGDCSKANPGEDAGKLCSLQIGERGRVLDHQKRCRTFAHDSDAIVAGGEQSVETLRSGQSD